MIKNLKKITSSGSTPLLDMACRIPSFHRFCGHSLFQFRFAVGEYILQQIFASWQCLYDKESTVPETTVKSHS